MLPVLRCLCHAICPTLFMSCCLCHAICPSLFVMLSVLYCFCHAFCPSLFMSCLYSNTTGCSEPMGMKSRLVSDGQLSASSAFCTWGIDAFTWHPQFARLDKQGKTNAWSPATNNRSEWLQVDLEKTKHLTGIITQGAKDFGVVQFVSAFKVAYSDDGQAWNLVKDENTNTEKVLYPLVLCVNDLFTSCFAPGWNSASDAHPCSPLSVRDSGIGEANLQPHGSTASKGLFKFSLGAYIFQGNIDNNMHKKNLFEPPFYARYLRVVPWEWHERITLRMELLGCDY
uniref:Milk fat globule EGF and factor V/VIII domain containing n=1 Tax=Hucho hucho TaxID=62062 RepID=A0A4W5R2L7_9TELE